MLFHKKGFHFNTFWLTGFNLKNSAAIQFRLYKKSEFGIKAGSGEPGEEGEGGDM
jgi:hypothetical protein